VVIPYRISYNNPESGPNGFEGKGGGSMKYFTKEWFDMRNGSWIYLLMTIAEEAETFSEEYFQSLYKNRLEKQLKMCKEMSERTVDDVYPASSFNNLSTMDEDGNFLDVSTLVSANEYEKIKEEILRKEQEARDNYVPAVYEEEKLTKQFHDNFIAKIRYLELILPQDILRDVADTRVLALDVVSQEIRDRIYQFCSDKEERALKVEREFREYDKRISSRLPEKIRKNYGFHDCRVTGFSQQGTDAVMELDHRGGFTNVCKVIYRNAVLLEQEDIVGTCWIYDEIYILEETYEFHAVLQDGIDEYKYFTLRAADIDFITD
jgi:hypothetical protein